MLHTSRQAVRFIFLAIGFVLFVVMSIISASSAQNRQVVAGKPHLMPWQSITSAPSVRVGGAQGGVALAPASFQVAVTAASAGSSVAIQAEPMPHNSSRSNRQQAAPADSRTTKADTDDSSSDNARNGNKTVRRQDQQE
jgi:hypothetical protein